MQDNDREDAEGPRQRNQQLFMKNKKVRSQSEQKTAPKEKAKIVVGKPYEA
jgi:hypothetical protein